MAIATVQPMQLSDEEYHCKVENMISASCEIINRVFQSRWKKETGKDWKHNEQQGKQFIKGLGKDAYKRAEPIQKSKLAKGCPDDWDICLLSLVLQNLGNRTNYAVENKSVLRLKDLRNSLAHNTCRKMTRSNYEGKVNVIQKSLKELGVEEKEIEQMIMSSGLSSSDEAFRMAKKCYDKAKRRMDKNNFITALKHCDEGIGLPCLTSVQLSVTYENRAECYLKFAIYKRGIQERAEGEGYLTQAIQDAKKALELNENSWKAHYTIGKCHRLRNECKIAIQHYTSALSISPVQEHVQVELNTCKLDHRSQSTRDYMNPATLPRSLRNLHNEFEAETGHKVTQHKFLRQWKRGQTSGKNIPGEEEVMRGNQYKSGIGVPPCDSKAFYWFEKASKDNNPEGLYALGDCYFDGKGVKRDPRTAYEIHLQAAKMSPDTPGNRTILKKNQGVTSSQFRLGTMFDLGIWVKQDYLEAARYYKLAADNGHTFAPQNLANLYEHGLGVIRNEKLAENYRYYGVILEDAMAASSLAEYYISNLEPAKAEAMFKTARHLDFSGFQQLSETKFKEYFEKSVLKRDENLAELLEFEKKHKLATKGLTFNARLLRKRPFTESTCMLDKLTMLARGRLNILELQASLDGVETGESSTDIDVKLLCSKQKEGSITACRILETRSLSQRIVRLLKEKETFNDKQKLQVLNMLYDCATLEFEVVHFPADIRTKLVQLIDELFYNKRGKKDEDEMKIRFVNVRLNYKAGTDDDDGSLAIDLLKKGIQMYPDNLHYYYLLCVYECDHQSGLAYAVKGLAKFPKNPNLLYFMAFFLRHAQFPTCECCKMHVDTDSPQKKKMVIDAYLEYLKNAETDHKFISAAYFAIALVHILINADEERMNHYYNLGKEAEENMLPCYRSMYGNCRDKIFLETFKSLENTTNLVGININTGTNSMQDLSSILIRKAYLDSPVRRWFIPEHRQFMKELCGKKQVVCPVVVDGLLLKRIFIQSVPEQMAQVKPITLKEINPTTSHIYSKRVLDLTIIDVPNTYCYCPVIHLIAEDEDGEITRLHIFNMKNNDENQVELELGSRIAILNPYMYTGTHPMGDGIRIDNPNCLINLGKVENPCRFCGDSLNAEDVKKCVKCKKAIYCSKECQELDWKVMKHKRICSIN